MRFVAEIMQMDAKEFWKAPPDVRGKVFETFAKTSAKVLVTNCPACPASELNEWQHVEGTPYCVRRLKTD